MLNNWQLKFAVHVNGEYGGYTVHRHGDHWLVRQVQ